MSSNATRSELPRRRLGRTDYQVTVYGVGGWLGVLDEPDAGPKQRETSAIAAVRRAVDLGVTYFDTSPSYGPAERHLGLGLHELTADERKGLRVATKAGTHPERAYHYDRDSILWSVERSLGLLLTDRVDVLLVHDPRTDQDMDQIMGSGGALEALESLKAHGVTGAIGIGVASHRFLRRAIESGRFDVILTPYDYTPLRASARPIIELAAARDIGVINGSPYMAGLLAGIDPDLAAARRRPADVRELERARAIWRWCQERQLDLGAVAMQFSTRNEHIAVTLAGPRTATEVEANVAHLKASIPAAIWPELDRFLSDLGPAVPGGEAQPTP
jgi:aryl-alcohol dehydrogenase-like predicted oxidoreductase